MTTKVQLQKESIVVILKGLGASRKVTLTLTLTLLLNQLRVTVARNEKLVVEAGESSRIQRKGKVRR
jgi:hypothetical protein